MNDFSEYFKFMGAVANEETYSPKLSNKVYVVQAHNDSLVCFDLVADLFLNPQQEIVATRGRAPGSSRQFTDQEKQEFARKEAAIAAGLGLMGVSYLVSFGIGSWTHWTM